MKKMRRCPKCKRLVDADSDEWAIVKCIDCVRTAVDPEREASGRYDWWDDDDPEAA